MDFKSRFKEKISHVTKEGVVGAISQNSQPVTKFKVSNTNLHFKIFTKNNPELENKVQLDFSPYMHSNPSSSKNLNYLDSDISYLNKQGLFKERSSEEIKARVNFQQTTLKNIRSANDTPATSLSPLYKDLSETNKLINLPFLPGVAKKDRFFEKPAKMQGIPQKTRFSNDVEDSPYNKVINSPRGSPLMKKNDEGYTGKWVKIKEIKKQQPLVQIAEKNLIGDYNNNFKNEFLEKKESKNNTSKNFYKKPTNNLKTLEIEIGKVLDKLNEISDNLKVAPTSK